MDSLGAGRLRFLRALCLLATLACLESHVIRAGANDVLHSGLTALNAASSGQGETDNLGSVARGSHTPPCPPQKNAGVFHRLYHQSIVAA
jgi:hypothetical protein